MSAFERDRWEVVPRPDAPSGMDIVWMAGRDGWRDLTSLVEEHRQVTMVTARGTARLLDLLGDRTARVPLPSGKGIAGDLQWLPLGRHWSLTPCGLVLEHETHWARSTSVVALFAGMGDWTAASEAPDLLERVKSGQIISEGHPDRWCGAYYCSLRGPD